MSVDQQNQERKKKTSNYTQKLAEEKIAKFLEEIPEMKHVREMQGVISITKDIMESGFDVSNIHQLLAERAMAIVVKSLEEGNTNYVEDFIRIAKSTIANVDALFNQASEISYSLAMKNLEEGDVGLVNRFYQIGKHANENNKSLESQLEEHLIELALKKINDDEIGVVENYLQIATEINPEISSERQKISEKSMSAATVAFDAQKFDLTEKYVSIASKSGGDVASSFGYLVNKTTVYLQKEMQVPLKNRNIHLVRQLIVLLSATGGNSLEFEDTLNKEFRRQDTTKTIRNAILFLLIIGAIGLGAYEFFVMKKERKLQEQIENIQKEDSKKNKDWETKFSNFEIGKEIYSFQNIGKIVSLCISKNGKYISAVGDNYAKIWKINDGNILEPEFPQSSSEIFSSTIAYDSVLIYGTNNEISISEFSIFQSLRATNVKKLKSNGWIYALAISQDENTLVSVSDPASIKIFQNWNSNNISESIIDNAHLHPINSLLVSKNYIVSGSEDLTIKIWNLSDKQNFKTFENNFPVKILEISSDESKIFTGDINGNLKIWNINDGTSNQFQLNAGEITSIKNSNDDLFIGTSSGKILLWDLETNSLKNTFSIHDLKITSLAVRENILVSSDENKFIKVVKFK